MDEKQLLEYLKNNLMIELKKDSYGHDDKYMVVRLLLNGEEISKSEVSIS
jgi:hypothetical protein